MKFSEMTAEQLEKMISSAGTSSRGRSGKLGQKDKLLALLKEAMLSRTEAGAEMGISNRNISSLLTYLRDDGYIFRESGERVILWSVIRDGVKVKTRVQLGDKGREVRFNFKAGKFEDEIKVKVEAEVETKAKK